MDISLIERLLWDAVEKGVLNGDSVDEVIVRMRAAEADLIEAQTATQDREKTLPEAIDRFNQATSAAASLLDKAANNY
ncbi:MAG: hypothetical protein LC751_07645 [Actinobacteria bacterium]|nr:hypothetical protein [Actinomycetota bacterium]